ncbi:hypothetical protein F7725_001447 [Dissostichus mawsoni]|uniref:Agmatinase n=1 Tax=Dissostichus mawsoni TaxID=36200 RepID=A0A7J5ZHA0_DISMA|nr:hypothetical protein F7725_001447 [Dissostichus mawsoni]
MWSLCRNFIRPALSTGGLPSLRRSVVAPPVSRSYGTSFNVPPSAEFVSRVSGIPTMNKLPHQESAEGLDAAFIGVPIDTGTSNRPGARLNTPVLRSGSAELLLYHSRGVGHAAQLQQWNRAAPYDSLMVADIGDVNVNLYDLKDTHGPVGLVHVDAHADTSDVVLGERIGHGTPFRRCVEEGLLDCSRVVQIGLRGSGYSADSYAWSRFPCSAGGGVLVQVSGSPDGGGQGSDGGGPVYLSFDIDALDPGFAPGTGTPEIAGLTPIQGVEIIRGCRGLNLVGCDLVEVSPPYDTTGNTALTGANLLFEMLCVLPNVKYL